MMCFAFSDWQGCISPWNGDDLFPFWNRGFGCGFGYDSGYDSGSGSDLQSYDAAGDDGGDHHRGVDCDCGCGLSGQRRDLVAYDCLAHAHAIVIVIWNDVGRFRVGCGVAGILRCGRQSGVCHGLAWDLVSGRNHFGIWICFDHRSPGFVASAYFPCALGAPGISIC